MMHEDAGAGECAWTRSNSKFAPRGVTTTGWVATVDRHPTTLTKPLVRTRRGSPVRRACLESIPPAPAVGSRDH